jgi:hypothetical protein
MENIHNIKTITNIQVHNIIEVPSKTIDLDVVISMVALTFIGYANTLTSTLANPSSTIVNERTLW